MLKNRLRKLIVEAMKYRDDSRPDPDVPEKLSTKDTSFSHVDLPNAPEGYSNFEEFLASDEYKKSLIRLERLTGEKNIGVGLGGKYAQLNMQARALYSQIVRVENQHKEELEELCERVLRQYFEIPENALQFNLNLNPPQGVKAPSKDNNQAQVRLAQELNDDINFERAKRRLINSITQGSSVNGTWLFRKLKNELTQITGDNNIIEKYSFFVSIMMLGYWQFTPQMMAMQTGGGGDAAGKTRLDKSTKPPTVNAEAMLFPFLIHETIKGVMEYLQRQLGKDVNANYEIAKELEDTIEKETWDIRLGPAIVRRVLRILPTPIKTQEEKRKIMFYMLVNVANLPARDYVVVLKEVLSNSDIGKRLLGAMYYDLTRKVDNEEIRRSESEFKRVLDSVKETISDDSLKDFLGSLGIDLSGQDN